VNHQVPWDPGGSTRHRLGVKPRFKEGGMLATLLLCIWAATIGPGPAPQTDEEVADIYQRDIYRRGRLGSKGFGLAGWLVTLCYSSSTSVSSLSPPLLPRSVDVTGFVE
jgi:hypothetical protein